MTPHWMPDRTPKTPLEIVADVMLWLVAVIATVLMMLLGMATAQTAGGLPKSCQASLGSPAASFTQVTVSTTAVGLGTIPTNAPCAIVVIEKQPIRYRDDGTAPTATVGTLVSAGGVIAVGLGQLSNFKMIRDTAATGDATADVNWYR